MREVITIDVSKMSIYEAWDVLDPTGKTSKRVRLENMLINASIVLIGISIFIAMLK